MTSTPPDDTDLGPPHNVLVQMGTVIPVFFFAPSLPTKYIDPPMFPTVLFISQAVNFCILLIASIVYEAPQGTVQQIDGPWRLEYQTYENMGRIICLHIASWLFSWTYLDFRFLPLGVFAFCYSFWWTPGIIMGHRLLATKFPARDVLKDIEKAGV